MKYSSTVICFTHYNKNYYYHSDRLNETAPRDFHVAALPHWYCTEWIEIEQSTKKTQEMHAASISRYLDLVRKIETKERLVLAESFPP